MLADASGENNKGRRLTLAKHQHQPELLRLHISKPMPLALRLGLQNLIVRLSHVLGYSVFAMRMSISRPIRMRYIRSSFRLEIRGAVGLCGIRRRLNSIFVSVRETLRLCVRHSVLRLLGGLLWLIQQFQRSRYKNRWGEWKLELSVFNLSAKLLKSLSLSLLLRGERWCRSHPSSFVRVGFLSRAAKVGGGGGRSLPLDDVTTILS